MAGAHLVQQRGVGGEAIQRLGDALDLHRQDRAVPLQRGKGGAARSGLEVQAEKGVGGSVPEQADRVDAAGDAPFRVLGIVGEGVGCGEQRGRQAVAGAGVDLVGALLVVDDQLAAEVEGLEHRAGQARLRPVPVGTALHLDVAAGQRAAGVQLVQHALGGGVHLLAGARRMRPVVTHAGKVRPVFCGKYGQLLVEVVDERAVAVEQVVQHLLAVAADAGVERQVGIAAADVDGVELHAARLPDVGQRARLAAEDVAAQQPVLAQHEAAGLAVGERQHRGSPPFLQYTAGTATAGRRSSLNR